MLAGYILLGALISAHIYMKVRAKMIWDMIGKERGMTVGVVRDMKRRWWRPLRTFVK